MSPRQIRRTVRRAHGEEGASLIIAMAFLLLFALLLTALLSFAVTSFGTVGNVADRMRLTYAADAAVDTAVQHIRQDPNMQVGRNSAYSGSQACDLTYQPTDGTPTASASCTPQVNSGAVRAGMDGNPANAILTTSGGITATGTGTLNANANVYSDGGITLNGGATLDAYDNAITARGACTPTIPGVQWRAVQTQCNVSASAPQYHDGDPPTSYVSQLGSGTLPLNKGPAACAGTNGIATFSPGYWTDPKKLTSLPGGCLAGVYYFRPGVYYFNLASRAGDVWSIKGRVVGGTPLGNWYSGGTAPPVPGANATAPVACDITQPGVQFVFGGNTQIHLDPNGGAASSLELCPSTDSHGDRISVYGALSCASCNSDPIVAAFNPSNFNNNNNYTNNAPNNCPSGAYGGSTPSWCTLPQPPPPSSGPTTPPIDGKVAEGIAPGGGGGGNKTETITFGGYDWSANNLGIALDQQPDIPPGLLIQSIQIVVRHREPDVQETPSITVGALVKSGNGTAQKTCTATPKPGSSAGPWNYDGWSLASTLTPPPTWTPPGTDVLNPPLACTGGTGLGNGSQITATRGNGANAQDLAKSLTVDYNVNATLGSLQQHPPQLDGLQIIVTLIPQVAPQGGCTTGDPGGPPCSFLLNNAGAQGHAGIWGTVYTPNAFIGISGSSFDFASSTNIVFNRGVIVSSMDIAGLPATDDKGRFRLGDGSGRTVELVSNPASYARVRALVRIVDSATASPHGFLTVVRQWSTAKP
jgi:Tfp pilus assembly protein PilX